MLVKVMRFIQLAENEDNCIIHATFDVIKLSVFMNAVF